MSAPIRASQNGERGCLTDSAAEPFGLACSDHAMPESGGGCLDPRFSATGFSESMPLVLSWLQSGSRRSSLAAEPASFGSIAMTPAPGACSACATVVLVPASANSKLKPRIVVLEIITLPARSSDNAFTLVQNHDVADFVAERIDNEGIVMRIKCAKRFPTKETEHRLMHRVRLAYHCRRH